MTSARAFASVIAVSLSDAAVDLLVGAVIFILVVLVAALLMFILQAVLPGAADRGATEPQGEAMQGSSSDPDALEAVRSPADESGTG